MTSSTKADSPGSTHAEVLSLQGAADIATRLRQSISAVIYGQDELITETLACLIAGGHSLLTGAPGLAKTTLVRVFAKTLGLQFGRIQFTPDLLPSDIVGSEILNLDPETSRRSFEFSHGPVFTNLLLADEINRASPRTQSALLEAMQERTVTVAGKRHVLPQPFLVFATQNPFESEGTFPLPEAQMDRFMLNVVITYPTREDERKVIAANISKQGMPKANIVLKPEDILAARNVVKDVYMDEKIERYIVDIVFATRFPKEYKLDKFAPLISYGGSPRASINLALAAKAYAFIKRRGYVIPEDVRAVCLDVMRHRIGLTYEAEAENITTEHIINELLNAVEVP